RELTREWQAGQAQRRGAGCRLEKASPGGAHEMVPPHLEVVAGAGLLPILSADGEESAEEGDPHLRRLRGLLARGGGTATTGSAGRRGGRVARRGEDPAGTSDPVDTGGAR